MALYAAGMLFFLWHILDAYRRGSRTEVVSSLLILSGLALLLARGLRLLPPVTLALARPAGSILALSGLALLFQLRRRRRG